jgi:hypothetical protein
MENVIHIDTTQNKDRPAPRESGKVIDITIALIKRFEENALKEWTAQLIEATDPSRQAYKTRQMSMRDMEIRFLEQLQQDLKEYGIELIEVQNQLNNTTSVLDRKVLWKHMKVLRDKMDAARRGIAIKRKNIERMDF